MKQRLRKKLLAKEFTPRPPLTAWQRIQAELRRQRANEGYSEAHDDAHQDGALERAADAYALPREMRGHLPDAGVLPAMWPWEARYWKPTPEDRPRELVKAGALYEAEIQRLVRIEEKLHAASQALSPPVAISVYDIEASKLSRHFERVHAKQALVETELNRAMLAAWLPTETPVQHPPEPAVPRSPGQSDQSQAWLHLAPLRKPAQQKGTPWLVKWQPLSEGRMELVVAIWEYPHGYDFDARWLFDDQGRCLSYRATQGYPKRPNAPASLYRDGPSGRYLTGQPGWGTF